MGLGHSKIKDIMFENFDDALAAALARVHKNSQVIYVDSNTGLSTANGLRIDSPCATIDQAINLCTANRGDTIIVLPRHAETIVAAAGIAADVAGINIIGLNVGGQKPQITFATSTGASFAVSANGIKVKGIVGIAGIDALTNPFDLSGDDLEIDLEWREGSQTVEAARAILCTGVDRSKINLVYRGQTGGDACVNGIRLVGSTGVDINIDFYGKASTSVVEFLTTACADIDIKGSFYVSGTTNLSKNVVDTVTGSTWTVTAFDGAAGASFSGGSGSAVASDDISSVASNQLVPTADVSTNTASRDVIGNKTDASIYVPGATNSIVAYLKGTADLQERVALKSAATITNGQTLFTIAGGPIQIMAMTSICATTNDATASTLQYSVTPTSGSAQTISAASASLANAAAGASVTLAGTALATAALYNANGPNLIANPGTIMAPAGVITAVVGVGSTTGTWRHYIRYRPLATGVTVS